jgi:type IV pilus assembly protein PilA
MRRAMFRVIAKKAGFSLIELMVVVAIIGVLAAVAIPNFARFQRKAKQSEAKAQMGGIYTAHKVFRAEWESYTTDMVAMGFTIDGQVRYNGHTGGTALNPPPEYSGPTMPTAVSLSVMCAGTFPCRMIGTTGTLVGGTIAAAFTYGTNGWIGGAAEDRWTINQLKFITNSQDGIAGN